MIYDTPEVDFENLIKELVHEIEKLKVENKVDYLRR